MPEPIIPGNQWDFVTEASVKECLIRAANGTPARVYDPKDNQRFMVVKAQRIPGSTRIKCILFPADTYPFEPDYERGDEDTLQISPEPIASIEIEI